MTNTELLTEKIDASGLKRQFIAEQVGLTYQGLMYKVNGKNEFKASEIVALKGVLGLTPEEVDLIFFSVNVD